MLSTNMLFVYVNIIFVCTVYVQRLLLFLNSITTFLVFYKLSPNSILGTLIFIQINSHLLLFQIIINKCRWFYTFDCNLLYENINLI